MLRGSTSAALAESALAGGLHGSLDLLPGLRVQQLREFRSTVVARAQVAKELPLLGCGWPGSPIVLVRIHTAG